MSLFSGTEDDSFQKNLVKPYSEITYNGDVTLIVEMKLKVVSRSEGGENLRRFMESVYKPVDSKQVD
jgi:hypothetical protein